MNFSHLHLGKLHKQLDCQKKRVQAPTSKQNIKTFAEKESKQQSGDWSSRSQAGNEWLQMLLARFNPVRERSDNTQVLDFERPLIELDKRISEVRAVAEANDVDVSEQVAQLEERAEALRRDTFSRLTPHQRLQVARHQDRPTCLDIILNITDKFVELHGDRAGMNDPAVVCGVGSIAGKTMMFIGHQKGRNTTENIERNFGMPQPNGYRKALRFMKHANKFGFPIVTFIDTPGAFPGQEAEEKGQGEAIARNLLEMFGFRVPMLTVVIGEGGSGGALAIGCGNKMYMLEHAVYYVASPEACAAILWKKREAAPQAAAALKITSTDLVRLGIVDDVIPEPMGGAHQQPEAMFPTIRSYISRFVNEYENKSDVEILQDRYSKFRQIGVFNEFSVKAGEWEDTKAKRAKSTGVFTDDGTWAVDSDEAEYMASQIAKEAAFQELLNDKSGCLSKPAETPWSLQLPSRPVSVLKMQEDEEGEVAAEENGRVLENGALSD